MNLYQAVGQGWRLSGGLLLFWSSQFIRPLGGALYLALYSLFGFHPFPFKLLLLLLLTANLLLAWRIGSLLFADSGIGALVVLLICYHASLPDDLVYNFGNFDTIYDIACFTFVYAAFWIWLEARRGGRFPSVRTVLGVAALQILALDSKEMAVALPVLLLLWELFYGNLVSQSRPRLQWRTLPAIALLSLITLVFLIGKSHGPGSLLNIATYQPILTPAEYLQVMSNYLNLLFYCDGFFQPVWVGWFLGGVLVLAALLRARLMAFGWLWFLISVLPVAFLPGRGGSVLYIPTLGLALAAVDLWRTLFRAAQRIPRRPLRWLDPAGLPLFVAVMACLAPAFWQIKRSTDQSGNQAARQYRDFTKDLTRDAAFRQASSLLFLRDPFDTDGYDPIFLSSLLRGDHGLKVVRAKSNQMLLAPQALAPYDQIYDFEKGHFRRLTGDELSQGVGQIRAALGYVSPDFGIHITDTPWWWAQQDFGMTALCALDHPGCVLMVYLLLPVPPFASEETCTLTIDVNGARWRDVSVPARFDPDPIEIPLPAGQASSRIRFHMDHAVPPGRPPNPSGAVLITSAQLK